MMRRRVVVLARQRGRVDLGSRLRRRSIVTGGAQRISGRVQLQRMRIVTVAAANAFGVHPALQEGTVLVHFAFDLPIGMVEAGLEQRGQVLIHQARPVAILTPERGASRMTTSARFDLYIRIARAQIELEAEVRRLFSGGARLV